MGKEIERKFLVKNESWKTPDIKGIPFRQGYLSSVKERIVRVRTINNRGFITIKGEASGITRPEYEYEIPVSDADEILTALCEKPLIEKKRYRIEYAGHTWEIDEFFGDNEGLVIAELELESEDMEFEKPEWAGEEVSGDPRYFNSNLIKNPFKNWKK